MTIDRKGLGGAGSSGRQCCLQWGGHTVGRDLGGQNARVQDQLNCKGLWLAAREGSEVGRFAHSSKKYRMMRKSRARGSVM